jgi:hypothetical protein
LRKVRGLVETVSGFSDSLELKSRLVPITASFLAAAGSMQQVAVAAAAEGSTTKSLNCSRHSHLQLLAHRLKLAKGDEPLAAVASPGPAEHEEDGPQRLLGVPPAQRPHH